MDGRQIKKRFSWSLETRLLLIEAVTMVDRDHAVKLQTIEKVMQMVCETTPEAAAAAVATIPITQQEKWQNVASRLQSMFGDSIAEERRWSICHSQFVKLQQYLKFMKPHADHSYRRANGKRDRIMTSKLCGMLTRYHAAFRLNGENEGSRKRLTLRSDQDGHAGHIRLSNDKRGHVEHVRLCKDLKDGGKNFTLTFDKLETRARKQLRLCYNDQKDRGERFPSSEEKKVCGRKRKRKLRLCHNQKGPGKVLGLVKVKKRRVERVPLKSSEKSAPQSLSAYSLEVCPLNDISSEHLSMDIAPLGVFPLKKDEQLLGEQVPLSSDREGRPVDSPLSKDEKRNRELVPFSNDHEGSEVDSAWGNDENTGSFASLDKFPSSRTNGRPVKKYFKWSLETRLLLIEAVAMVDGDHAAKLRTIEKAMQILCGATAEAAATAVATIPFPQQERWQDVASRLPSIFDDSTYQDKRCSICRSQFVKLKQCLKLMKPQGGSFYRKANGNRDPFITSELCPKLTEYDAAFYLSENPKSRGQRLSLKRVNKSHGRLFRVSNGHKKGGGQDLRLCNFQKGGEEDIPSMSSKNQKRSGKKLRLCNDQKKFGKCFPSRKDKKVCGRERKLRLCNRQNGPGKNLCLVKVKKHRVEHVLIKGSDKSAPQRFSAICLKVCPPHGVSSGQCSKKFTPQGFSSLTNTEELRGEQVPLSNDRERRRRVDSPLSSDKRDMGEQVHLSNDQEGRGVDSPELSNDERSIKVQVPSRNSQGGRGVDSPLGNGESKCNSTEEIPLSNDRENHGMDSPLSNNDRRNFEEAPRTKNREGRGVDSPSSNDEKRSMEDSLIVSNDKDCHGVEFASLSNDGEDVALSIDKTGHAEDIPSSNEKGPCPDSPELAASRDEEDSLEHGHPMQGQKMQQPSGREVPKNRLVEITDYSRSNVFMWSEESRLQVIKGVLKTDSKLSRMGQIRSWRHVAECLPKKLFWDVDVDRLAVIARKQFSELRRRYLMVKENETTGAVTNLKFNSMTEQIIREMEIYEESLVRRASPAGPTRELCIGKHQKVRWLTKKPRLLRIPKAQRGHGAIVVEIFILPSGCLQDNSSRCFNPEFDSYDDFTCRDEQSMLPYHMESSDYEDRDNCERLQSHSYHESGSEFDHRRSVHMQIAAGSYSEEEFNYSEKGYDEKFEDREQNLDLQGTRTLSSPSSEANWHSEPFYENEYERNVMEESPYRQQGCSSFTSRSLDHRLDGNHRFKNQQRILCDRQRRMNSGDSEYPGWDSTGCPREDSDSASTGGRSRSLKNSETVAHGKSSDISGSKDFVQSDSGEPFKDETREDSIKRKRSTSADRQWHESLDRLDCQTSPIGQHHGDYDRSSPPTKRARSSKVHFKTNCEANRSSSPTDFSEAEHDEVANDAPILDQILTKVDLEFSRLNWWVNHQLFPTGREKITSGIKSASISDALDKRLESAGALDQVISKCRQKRILWVLKAELQHVRLRLVDEIDKSSQIVVQEVLQSFKI